MANHTIPVLHLPQGKTNIRPRHYTSMRIPGSRQSDKPTVIQPIKKAAFFRQP